ncbi:MAG: serine/threonine protein kinase [Verrucomicrobiaceae bacterium]|nr:serine/threonine protein kinase [Verrucomicrobiaceae bacterium]
MSAPAAKPEYTLPDALAAGLLRDVLSPVGDGPEREGDELGPYRLVERIGEGGFGDVWRAEQTRPVRRTVALKVLKPGMDSREVLGRFEQERQVLGGMEHPHIAALLDAGMTADGRSFFVMELVKGVPLTRYCREGRLPLRERILLFRDVCMGVQHAHQKGVIHRDLKPTNILVTEVDGRPVPKIIDFGIAKAMHGDGLAGLPHVTLPGTLVGTPLYMSPEQIDDLAGVDTRSDIYALGVLLYELIAGRPPVDVVTLGSCGQAEMRRIIREERPRPPSHHRKLARERAAGRRLESTKLVVPLPAAALESNGRGTEVPGRGVRPPVSKVCTEQVGPVCDDDGITIDADLDWITLCALEKEPARRYPSAAEFAADLQRYLDRLPVLARPPSPGYVVGRWMRRHRAAFAAACVSVLALVGGAAVALWQAAVARQEKMMAEQLAARSRQAEALAQEESARAHRTAAFLTALLDSAADEISKGRNPEAFKLALERSAGMIGELENDPLLHGQVLDRLAIMHGAIGDWKTALSLMQQRVTVLGRLHGAESAEAREAELSLLKREAEHGSRALVPPRLEALRQRVEKTEGRGGRLWFHIQREIVRVWTKLDDERAAVAASSELLAEAERQKLTGRSLLTAQFSHVSVLQSVGDFDEAEALLSRCRDVAVKKRYDAVLLKQIDDRLLGIMVERGDHRRAVAFLRQRLDQTRASAVGIEGRRLLIATLNQLTIQETAASDHEAARGHGTEALALARTLEAAEGQDGASGRAEVGESLRRLAECESAARRHEDAIRHVAELKSNAMEQGGSGPLLVALRCQGEVLRNAGRLAEACSCFEERDVVNEQSSPSGRSRAEALEQIYRIRMDQGRAEDALALAGKMWSRMIADPSGSLDTGHLAYLAAFGTKAWDAVREACRSAQPPVELTAWKEAIAKDLATRRQATLSDGK